MKRADDISFLLTDKTFQKALSEWTGYNNAAKNSICQDYDLKEQDVELLRQVWLGLDFKRIEQSQEVIEQELQKTIWKLAERKNKADRKSGVRLFYDRFAKIAAVLIIPLILYTAYIQFLGPKEQFTQNIAPWVTVNSQAGTVTNLVLPDGSKVFLNSGSSITYPNHFSGNTRNVSLIGEGYFMVTKNKQMPMIVSAGNLNFKVYGTSFNVNSYPSENFVKVTLVEGSISLSSKLGKFNGEDEFFITPGQTVTYFNESKQLNVQNVDTYLFTAWKDGLLVFRNTTFESVLKQLSRRYNVNIELKDEQLASIPMDATFRDENINEILRLLSLGTRFKYRYAPTKKLPDGSFERSKIYIEKSL